MKIRKIILLCSLVFTSFAMPVFASEAKEPYFTTYMGVELTEEEYNNLARGFDFDTIDTMPQEMINKFKNIEDLKRIEKTVYVVTESFYTPTGTLIGNIEKQYTEKEYQQLLKNNEYSLMDNSGSSGSSTHTTSSKKITISVNGYSETAVSATIRNEWLTDPAVRSYDVLGIRVSKETGLIRSSGHLSGFQRCYVDGELHTTTYDQDSGWVIDGSGGLLGVYSDVSGAGLSQNLVNNGTNIVNSATIYFTGPSFPITLYGAYEHATETVTLAQSQNYKINKNGKGSVFDFASSVVDKYDNTQGVEITVSLPF